MFSTYQLNHQNIEDYLREEGGDKKRPEEEIQWWNIPVGLSMIRILPPWDPSGRVALPVYTHSIEFTDQGYTKYNWTCINRTFGKPCAICEGLAKLEAGGINTDVYKPNRRVFYFNVLVLLSASGDVPAGTHALMRGPKALYDFIVSLIMDPNIACDVTDIDQGMNILVTRKGSGLQTKYDFRVDPLGKTAILKKFLEPISELYNLDEIFSTGFEQDKIDRLMQSLQSVQKMIPNTVNLMAGYPQPVPQQPQNQIPQPVPAITIPPSMPSIQTLQQPLQDKLPWEPQDSTSQVVQTSTQPVQTASEEAQDKPKCFGQYNQGVITCVICPYEINCSQAGKGVVQ